MTGPDGDTESLQALRVLAVVEGLSFVLLLVTSVLKRTTDYNFVPVMGPVHGFLYVAVVLLVLENLRTLGWSRWFTAVMLTVGSPGIHFPLQAQVRKERREPQGYPPR
jgi:integral membrane protein